MERAKPQHLPFLDGLRGVAVVAVFLFHALAKSFGVTALPWNGLWREFSGSKSLLLVSPAMYGWAGVAIFFAVSGFCIHLSHARSGEAGFGRFAVRRFFRIYPAYILSFAILLCFPPLVPADAAQADPGWQVFSHILLVQNLDLRTLSGVNPVFWSIAVEAQLYLIYPLLLMAVRRWGWPVALTGCAVIEVGIRAMQSYLGHAHPDTMNEMLPGWVGFSPLAFWFSWSIGAWVADAWLQKKPLQVSAPVVAGALVVAVVAFHFAWTVPFSFTAFAVAAAAFCAWALNRAEPQAHSAPARWLGRHLSFAGKVSYSFYLVHNPLLFLWIAVLGKYWPGQEHLGLVRFGTCLAVYPAILFISHLFYRYVELPSITWGQGVLERRRAAAVVG